MFILSVLEPQKHALGNLFDIFDNLGWGSMGCQAEADDAKTPRSIQHLLTISVGPAITEGRTQESIDDYSAGLAQEQGDDIEGINLDLWALYISATPPVKVPTADKKIAFDRHVISDIGKAVDMVPKPLHRDLVASDDGMLKGSKYLWLYRRGNVSGRWRKEIAALIRQEFKLD